MIRSKLKKLQQEAQQLELNADRRNAINQKALDYAANYLDKLSNRKAFDKIDQKVSISPISEEPSELSELLDQLYRQVDTKGLNPASGGHLGYIPGGGLYPSAIGDYLAAISNRYAGILYSAPGAVQMENKCLRFLCDLAGYPSTAGGNLTSGGSMANLIAVVNARDNSGLKAKDFDKAALYCTLQLHHCVDKAIKFAGLQDAHQRTVSMDKQFRMKPDALENQIEQDIADGLTPLMIFASAGTTDVGAVDPLEEIGRIAGKHNIWFHVDAAYGGAFLLTDHGRKKMKGIHQADSIVIDPHKGFFLPYGTGALIVKDTSKLYESQHMSANYMQDTEAVTYEYSPADLSPELTKHFRGLRMWLPLQLFGIAPFRAALEEKLLLTQYFYEQAQEIDGIETGIKPELSVLIFRYVPETGDADQFNKKLIKAIQEDGRVFLSSTNVNGRFYIRLAVLSFRTHLDKIDQTIEILKEKIANVRRQV
jgi:glutamate/tyrosine decarboxylase-like PLP-dependent enzyme